MRKRGTHCLWRSRRRTQNNYYSQADQALMNDEAHILPMGAALVITVQFDDSFFLKFSYHFQNHGRGDVVASERGQGHIQRASCHLRPRSQSRSVEFQRCLNSKFSFYQEPLKWNISPTQLPATFLSSRTVSNRNDSASAVIIVMTTLNYAQTQTEGNTAA